MIRLISFLTGILLCYSNLVGQAPSIIWIVCEDISPTLSMYGDSTAKTPHLNALAAESLIFDQAFATVGVCAPSRSSIITGMYPTSIGTMHMRTGKDIQSWGKRSYKSRTKAVDIAGDSLREYAAVLPPTVTCFPEYLRKAGYFCTNNAKTDYQFAAPLTAWDENDNNAHWRHRAEGQPFFAVFNFNVTHESKLWKHDHLPLTVSPEAVPVPPYLTDDSISRRTIARHYSNIELLDQQVEKLLTQLKADGLYDETFIFFYSDHGGPLPRQKREAYDRGLRVPFFIKMPFSKQKGRTSRLISFVDLAPTLLSIAEIQPPDYINGKAFLGNFEAKPRRYLMGSGDRFDEYSDRVRILRDTQFLYVYNAFPHLPYYKDLAYRKQVPAMRQLLNFRQKDQLDSLQLQWFGHKSAEELYDCTLDPHNLHNLATDPAFQSVLTRMREAYWTHATQYPDLGQLPEAEMIQLMWPDGKQPQTSLPEVTWAEQGLALHAVTQGASIAYRVTDNPNEAFDFHQKWQLFHQPIPPQKGKYLYVIAERTGYKMSEMLIFPMQKN